MLFGQPVADHPAAIGFAQIMQADNADMAVVLKDSEYLVAA
jgi:hypothetical protein